MRLTKRRKRAIIKSGIITKQTRFLCSGLTVRHSLGIVDENPANQSLIAQNEAFGRIISLDSRYDVALVCAALGYKIYVLPLCPYFRFSLDLGEDNMYFAVLLCLIPDYKNVKNIIVY